MMRNTRADLEELALRRDRRFLIRLVLVLIVGIGAGLWVFRGLTGERFAGCAAQSFGGVAGQDASE